jgi:hypothetical protein
MVRTQPVGAVDSILVSHITLGEPPRSLTAGYPVAADRLRASRARLAARALEVAVAADPDIRARLDDAALRSLLLDTEVLLERLALCVAGDDSHWLVEFADQSATVFRRRKVGMDDVIAVCEGLRSAVRGTLSDDEMAPATRALDAAVSVFRRTRGIAGDARKRNKLVTDIYKGI